MTLLQLLPDSTYHIVVMAKSLDINFDFENRVNSNCTDGQKSSYNSKNIDFNLKSESKSSGTYNLNSQYLPEPSPTVPLYMHPAYVERRNM